MAFPVVEATNETAQTNTQTAHTTNLPAGITAGDLLIVIFGKGGAAACTMNALTGWTELIDENLASGLGVLYRLADGSEGSTIALTVSTANRGQSIAFRISGAADPGTQPPEISTVATGTSTSPDPGSVSVTGGAKDCLFIATTVLAGEEADDDTFANAGSPANYSPSPPLQKTSGTAGTNVGGAIVAAYRQLNASSAGCR